MSKSKAAFSKKNFTSTPMRFEFDDTSILNLSDDNNDDSVHCTDVPFGDITPNFNSSFKYLRAGSAFSSSQSAMQRMDDNYLKNKKFNSSQSSQLIIASKKKSITVKKACSNIFWFIFFMFNCLVMMTAIEYFSVPKSLAFGLWNFFDYSIEDTCL